MCESEYNDLQKTFYKLKSSSPPSPVYPFEDTVYPSLLASPLTKRQLQPSVRITGALISHSPPGSDPGPTTRKSKAVSHTRKNAPATVLSTLQGAQTYMKALSSDTGDSSSPPSSCRDLTKTAKYFDRDPETKEVLWFSAPPAYLPSRVQLKTKPKHSLAYLHALAERKRKGPEGLDEARKAKARRTVQEDLAEALKM